MALRTAASASAARGAGDEIVAARGEDRGKGLANAGIDFEEEGLHRGRREDDTRRGRPAKAPGPILRTPRPAASFWRRARDGPGVPCDRMRSLMVGSQVKHYEIEAVLGKGGMGVVYRARDTRLGRPVALKFLSEELTKDPARRDRFLREARAACAVNHPAIAQVYDVDEVTDGVFMAMELVEGKTVRALIKGRELDLLGVAGDRGPGGRGPLQGPRGRDRPPGHQARERGRDPGRPRQDPRLRPGQAARPAQGARARPRGDELSHMETMARTQAGMVLGTLRYMSPEQARGQELDHRSDIFSLGVMLYEMVTGQLPFSGNSPIDTLHAIAFEETRPITALRANLPPSLQRVISRCLRKRAPGPLPRHEGADQRPARGAAGGGERHLVEGAARPPAPGAPRVAARPDAGRVGLAGGGGRRRHRGPRRPRPRGGRGHPLPLHVLDRRPPRSTAVIRNRRYRATRRFTSKARKLQEVRIVAVDGLRITVVADKALARTYVRINALVDAMNARMFFGDPFKVVVRDDLTPEETKALLTSPGVLYVREDRALPRRLRPPFTGGQERSRVRPARPRASAGFTLPVDQGREGQPFSARGRDVAREGVDEGQGPGLREDAALGRRPFHARLRGTVGSRHGQRVAEGGGVRMTVHRHEQIDEAGRGDHVRA